MSQTEIEPVRGACRHMRARFKLTPSRRSPLPEKRLLRYECEKGCEIDSASEEQVQKCLDQRTGCWQTDA